ncbi:MAG: MIP/aquaporin family protein [Longimicrobiales bacterium]
MIGPGAAMVDAHTGGTIGHAGVALAFAFVVLALVYALGHLSGAHINPAVTLAFWSARRFPGRAVPAYLLAQCAGAIVASLTLRSVVGPVGQLGATVPAIPVGAAFAVEWLLSFILMFVIAAAATDERVADGFAGVAVGLTVGFDAMMGGPLTGASMNPARSLGPAVAGGIWTAHWICWLAPISAMMIAARVYDALRPAHAAAVLPTRIAAGAEGRIGTHPAGLTFEQGDSLSPRSDLESTRSAD